MGVVWAWLLFFLIKADRPTVWQAISIKNRIGTYISNIRPKMRCKSEIGTTKAWPRPP